MAARASSFLTVTDLVEHVAQVLAEADGRGLADHGNTIHRINEIIMTNAVLWGKQGSGRAIAGAHGITNVVGWLVKLEPLLLEMLMPSCVAT